MHLASLVPHQTQRAVIPVALGPAPCGARSRCRDRWSSFPHPGLEGLEGQNMQVALEVQEAASEELVHVLGPLEAPGARRGHRAKR